VPQGYKKNFGAEGESAACAFLESHGFSVISKNFYAGRSGEIDIIVVKDKPSAEEYIQLPKVKRKN